MNELLTSFLLLFGASFMLLAALGVVRLPDLFTRMHAATKSGTLGVSGTLLAVAVYFDDDLGVATRAVLAVVFMYMTAPVAAHFIGRAAYLVGVPMWERSVADELRGKYDPRTGRLASAEPETQSSTGDKPE